MLFLGSCCPICEIQLQSNIQPKLLSWQHIGQGIKDRLCVGQWYNWCLIVHLQFVYKRQRKNEIHTLVHGRLGKRSGNKFVQISEIISYCDDASFKSRFLPQYWPGVLLNEYDLLSQLPWVVADCTSVSGCIIVYLFTVDQKRKNKAKEDIMQQTLEL